MSHLNRVQNVLGHIQPQSADAQLMNNRQSRQQQQPASTPDSNEPPARASALRCHESLRASRGLLFQRVVIRLIRWLMCALSRLLLLLSRCAVPARCAIGTLRLAALPPAAAVLLWLPFTRCHSTSRCCSSLLIICSHCQRIQVRPEGERTRAYDSGEANLSGSSGHCAVQ